MKKLGKKAGHGAPGKAASMKKNVQEKKTDVPGEWIYLAPAEITVRDIALDAEQMELETELWDAAGVVEVLLAEKASMDFERTQIPAGDEVLDGIVQREHCEAVYLVSFDPKVAGRAQELMQHIVKMHGGLFCADTEELQPVIR